MPSSDTLFDDPHQPVSDFRFDGKVAAVFDDMLERSVPFYRELQRMIAELAADHAVAGTRVYDLGCSTGTTLLNLGRSIAPAVEFIGLDESDEMLVRCREKLAAYQFERPVELVRHDLNQPPLLENASVVLLVLTLQFVRPLNRDALLRRIREGLNPEGCLILVEKVLSDAAPLNRRFIDHYHEFKRRNGYSELEIARKREALENILIPYTLDENRRMLGQAGFGAVEVFFKWYNFCGFIATR